MTNVRPMAMADADGVMTHLTCTRTAKATSELGRPSTWKSPTQSEVHSPQGFSRGSQTWYGLQ